MTVFMQELPSESNLTLIPPPRVGTKTTILILKFLALS